MAEKEIQRARILRALEELAQPLSLKVIEEKAGLGRAQILGLLRGLIKAGYVQAVGKPAKYLITEKGKELTIKLANSKDAAARILKYVAPHHAFHFYIAIGQSTGQAAKSLAEFCDFLKTIDVRSIEFHLPRGDFEKWIKEVLSDIELSAKIVEIKKLGLKGEELRKKLYETVKARYDELSRVVQA
ncbi:helix-turn-helix domain-containing protein [Candidatus Bathyarchaeota archaeon]|nr:helix-turn-helix domain-containing protein [Candidatus Bathyarchaeota archaeon]